MYNHKNLWIYHYYFLINIDYLKLIMNKYFQTYFTSYSTVHKVYKIVLDTMERVIIQNIFYS